MFLLLISSVVADRFWAARIDGGRSELKTRAPIDGCVRAHASRRKRTRAQTPTRCDHRELRWAMDGGLEFRPSPVSGCGRGVGSWRRSAAGVFEGQLQMYVYSQSSMPDEPVDLLLLGVESVAGQLECCIFTAEGQRQQIGETWAPPQWLSMCGMPCRVM